MVKIIQSNLDGQDINLEATLAYPFLLPPILLPPITDAALVASSLSRD